MARTNTGLPKIEDKSPDNRPKTRRLEGGGDFPLIFFVLPFNHVIVKFAVGNLLFPDWCPSEPAEKSSRAVNGSKFIGQWQTRMHKGIVVCLLPFDQLPRFHAA